MQLSVCFLFLAAVYAAYGQTNCRAAGWSVADRQGILDVHNKLRSKIAKGTYVAKTNKKPAAKDMKKMTYDCNLEASAQAWANTCPSGHSRAAGKGENMYWVSSTGAITITGKGAAASKAWESEFQTFGWSSNMLSSALFGSGIGHATQMAWANTNKIGCGVKVCKAGKYNKVVVVCQYTPQGNIMNTNIYTSGATCSACAKGLTCEKTTGLCK